jgi:hypothetical protein
VRGHAGRACEGECERCGARSSERGRLAVSAAGRGQAQACRRVTDQSGGFLHVGGRPGRPDRRLDPLRAVTPVQAGQDRGPDRDRAPGRAPAVGQRRSRHLATRGEVRHVVGRRPGDPVRGTVGRRQRSSATPGRDTLGRDTPVGSTIHPDRPFQAHRQGSCLGRAKRRAGRESRTVPAVGMPAGPSLARVG